MPKPTHIRLGLPLGTIALSDGEQPTSWIQVAVAGDYESKAYGKFSITKNDLAQMLSNFASGKYPEPPTQIHLDYDHLSMNPGHAGDGKAAGWFEKLELRENGTELWALIAWTPGGADAVKSAEYKFVSPTFQKDFVTNTGEGIGCTLLCAAVTNRPFLQGMAPMSLSGAMAGKGIALAVLGDSDKRVRVDEAICREFNEPFGDPWCCYLVDIFGDVAVFSRDGRYYQVTFSIADDGTVSFVGQPVETVLAPQPLGADSGASLMANPQNTVTLRIGDKDTPIALSAVIAALSADVLEQLPLVKELRAKVPADGSVVVGKAEFDGLQKQIATLSANVTDETKKREAIELQLNTAKATKKVDDLLAAGKLLPTQKEWALSYALKDEAEFDKFSATLGVVVKLDQSAGSGQGGGDATAATQLEEKAKQLRAENPKLSAEQAYSLACEQNPALYEAVSA